MRYDRIIDAIGNTPLVEIASMSPKKEVRLFAKLEGLNPSGSLKDRIAKYMIEKAEASGELKPGKIILEPTSGNTGVSLAMLARPRGYRMIMVMRENVGLERKQLLETYGVEMVLTEAAKGTNGAIAVAMEMVKDPQYYMPWQYGNPANPQAHYETTGRELLEDLPDVNVFIAGMGTGGTVMGVGRRLKEHNSQIKIVGVEPYRGDPVHGLRSMEDAFLPPILNLNLLDARIRVHGRDAILLSKMLLDKEGILAGPSSGAVIFVARRIAERMDRGKIVVLLPDGGWSYLSTGLWTQEIAGTEGVLEGPLAW
ncbi:MAG: cysteine synthase family protein [Chloroflexi bacterium]|nr:cysteine synthase family protein [Chloroflexota bacterium]